MHEKFSGQILADLALPVDDDGPGTTGVVDVDFRYFEIRKLTQAKAEKLAVRIRQAACEGEKRFRWVAARFQQKAEISSITLK